MCIFKYNYIFISKKNNLYNMTNKTYQIYWFSKIVYVQKRVFD